MDEDEVQERTELARTLLSANIQPFDLEMHPELADVPDSALGKRVLGIPFPAGLEPSAQPIDPEPDPSAPLPEADVVVITWTTDETDALADVLTPGVGRAKWHRYAEDFDTKYKPFIRGGAPALSAGRMASYMPTTVGSLNVLCMKSELHLNQDGVKTGDHTATLPVRDLFNQILDEVKPTHILTIGTSGSVFADFQLGDVVVTRAAKFRLDSEFRNEAFNGQVFTSDWQIPTTQLDTAVELMQKFAPQLMEPPLGPPTIAFPFTGPLIEPPANVPDIKLEQGARDMPEFHPILTTDYFEYGTSENHLDDEGAAVEMGDAVLGLVASDRADPPNWLVLRNMSDPQINGALWAKGHPVNVQTTWAVAYYLGYGYWTSVTGALAAWGVLAGLSA
jgi:hypothetical protein